jgi:CHAD domain-containing protein
MMTMMRSPDAAFDLRAALVDEIERAIEIFNANPAKPKAIHKSRVALKRARALVAVGAVSAPGLAEVFDGSARAIMRTLGQARDNWVLKRTALRLSQHVGKRARRELQDLADRVEAYQRTAPAINVESLRAGLKDLLAIAQVWPEASPRQVERGVRQLARRAEKAWRRASKAKAADRHAWRKSEQARLYAASLLPEAWPANRPRRRRCCAELAERLGDEHDLALLAQRLAADHPANARPRALRVLHKAKKRLEKRADKLGKRLHALDG